MKFFINGEQREIADVQTLPELVKTLGLPSVALLVEHNGTALHRSEWDAISLAENDRLEFLRITAGG